MTPDALAHAARNLSDALSDLKRGAEQANDLSTLRPIWTLLIEHERAWLALTSEIGNKVIQLETEDAARTVRGL